MKDMKDEIILTQGSLNYLVKKREAQRIDRENFKMAGRISAKTTTLRNGNSHGSRHSLSSAKRGSTERSPRRVTSKAHLPVERMMQRHRDRICRAFGHFSGMSPDPSQVLPKIVSMQAVANELSGAQAELQHNQTLNSHLCDSSFNQLQI